MLRLLLTSYLGYGLVMHGASSRTIGAPADPPADAVPLNPELEAPLTKPATIMCDDPNSPGTPAGWCTEWLNCVAGASCPPEGDAVECAKKIYKAWGPAPPPVWCGYHGKEIPKNVTQDSCKKEAFAEEPGCKFLKCADSAWDAQKSLSSCVGKILFNKAEVKALHDEKPVLFNEMTGSCKEQLWAYKAATQPKAEATKEHFLDAKGCPVWGK